MSFSPIHDSPVLKSSLKSVIDPYSTPTFVECCEACRKGDVERIKGYILQKQDFLNEKDSSGMNLMHVAVMHGHIELVKWLHGQNPLLITQLDQKRRSPLDLAAFEEQIPLLLSFKKEMKKKFPTLVFLLAVEDKPKALAFFLEQRCDPNITNEAQETPLHLASKRGAH